MLILSHKGVVAKYAGRGACLPINHCGRILRAMIGVAINELDVWRAANLLIRQHGENAEIVAAQRADELSEREDYAGSSVWLRIMRAIGKLQAKPTGPLH